MGCIDPQQVGVSLSSGPAPNCSALLKSLIFVAKKDQNHPPTQPHQLVTTASLQTFREATIDRMGKFKVREIQSGSNYKLLSTMADFLRVVEAEAEAEVVAEVVVEAAAAKEAADATTATALTSSRPTRNSRSTTMS